MDVDSTPGNVDTVLFKEGVAPTDITLRRSGDDLFVSIDGTDDRLQLSGWFLDDAHKIERLQFSDGTVWDHVYMEEIATTPTDSDDYIVGTPADDAIDGGGGSDTIYGRDGDDQLFGGADSDLLYGEDGDDTIFGGAGDDTVNGGPGRNILSGGAGNDTIVATEGQNTILVNRGDGFDRITSHFIDPGAECDTIVFGRGITPDDLLVHLTIGGGSGSVPAASIYEYRDQLWKTDGSGGNSLELTIEIGNGEGVVIEAGVSNDPPPAAAAALGDDSGPSGSGGINPSDLAIKRFVFDDGTVLPLKTSSFEPMQLPVIRKAQTAAMCCREPIRTYSVLGQVATPSSTRIGRRGMLMLHLRGGDTVLPSGT